MGTAQRLERYEKEVEEVDPRELQVALLAIVRELHRAAAQQARAATGLMKACGRVEDQLQGRGSSSSL